MNYNNWINWKNSLNTERVMVEVYGRKHIEILTDDCRGYWIFSTKGTQEEKVNIIRNELINNKPELFVDLGANYGEFTAGVCDLNINTLCIEPNPKVASCLKNSFIDDTHITIVDKLCGSAHNKTVDFNINPNYSGGGSIYKNVIQSWDDGRYRQIHNQNETVKVEVVNLVDTIKEIYGKIPSSIFIKMDVEGCEDEIMITIEDMLSNISWWRVFYEYNPRAIESTGKSINDWNKLFDKYKTYGTYSDDLLIGGE
tara:strand:+ start:1661 stop:2425 length:765 start_codon:yes stop_codon:yes gene_type:complete